MKAITCIVIDDEPLAVDLIVGYVQKTPFLELAGKFYSPVEAMQFVNENGVDLIFVDIQMPGLTGIEFSQLVQGKSKVILTTAYSQYALDGYKVDALDYLVKPFNYQEFLRAANKAHTWFTMAQADKTRTAEVADDAIFVKSDYKLVKILFNDILYVEGLKDYLKIHLVNQPKPVLTLMTMKAIEERLPSSQFMRVHRSFIVNLGKITTIEHYRIIFGSTYIPVAESYKEKFRQFVNKQYLG